MRNKLSEIIIYNPSRLSRLCVYEEKVQTITIIARRSKPPNCDSTADEEKTIINEPFDTWTARSSTTSRQSICILNFQTNYDFSLVLSLTICPLSSTSNGKTDSILQWKREQEKCNFNERKVKWKPIQVWWEANK